MPDEGIVFKSADGLITNDVVVSDVHVIECSDE
jgi:hypothetical protein